MHYKIGVTCVFNGHKTNNLVIVTWQSNPPYVINQPTV